MSKKKKSVSDSERHQMLSRAVGTSVINDTLKMLKRDFKDAGHNGFAGMLDPVEEYILKLENALVESMLKRGSQRRELRRLNLQGQYVKVLEVAYSAVCDELTVIKKLLENDELETRDTDPTDLKCIGADIMTNFKNSGMVCACGTPECPKPMPIQIEDNFPTSKGGY